MRLEELEAVCQEAARGLLERDGRPVSPAVVLPLPHATRVLALPGFPDDDLARAHALGDLAADEMRPAGAPCYGFVAEAEQPDGQPLLVVVYGARGHQPRITAAMLHEDGLGEWVTAEDLHPEAMPFLRPLQAAAEQAEAAQPAVGGLPNWPAPGPGPDGGAGRD